MAHALRTPRLLLKRPATTTILGHTAQTAKLDSFIQGCEGVIERGSQDHYRSLNVPPLCVKHPKALPSRPGNLAPALHFTSSFLRRIRPGRLAAEERRGEFAFLCPPFLCLANSALRFLIKPSVRPLWFLEALEWHYCLWPTEGTESAIVSFRPCTIGECPLCRSFLFRFFAVI